MVAHVALLPEENLGIAVLVNFGLHGLRQSVVYHVIDAYLGAEAHDWERIFHERIERILEARAAAKTQREEARLKDTKPSLAPEAYTGRYTSAVYGDAEITLEDGVLTLEPKAHPATSGRLDHWQFDTYLCTWTDPVWDQSPVYFDLDDAGTVSQLRFTVRPDMIDPLEYVFVNQQE
jgi:hypothetical protein